MNIIIFQEAYTVGGADYSIISLINNWTKSNDNFTVLINDSHPDISIYSSTNAKIELYKSYKNEFSKLSYFEEDTYEERIVFKYEPILLKILVDISSKIKDLNPDVIFFNNGGFPGGSSHFLAVLIASCTQLCLKIMIVRNISPIKNTIDAKILVNSFFDHVVTVSNFLKEKLIEDNYIETKKITTIYNGTIIQHLKLQTSEYNRNSIIISIIGSVEYRKGHQIALEAIALLSSKNRNVELHIKGFSHSNDVDKFKVLIKDLNIEKYVYWFPHTNNINELYENIDIIIIPSLEQESFSRVKIEAMSKHIPIIISDCPGLNELIVNEENGLIVPRYDAVSLANAIGLIIDDDNLRIKIVQNAFSTCKKNYNISESVINYINLINRELALKHGK